MARRDSKHFCRAAHSAGLQKSFGTTNLHRIARQEKAAMKPGNARFHGRNFLQQVYNSVSQSSFSEHDTKLAARGNFFQDF